MWANGAKMKKGIVITTHESTEPFLLDCIKSLKNCTYPITIIYNTNENNEYESIGLKVGMNLYDEFIYLHDTVVIKDLALFDLLFAQPGMFSISPKFLMYLGKYDSKILKNTTLPHVHNKLEAIKMEFWLQETFICPCFDATFIDGNHTFEEKYGKTRMVLENKYIKKYKSCWDIKMVQEYEERK